MAVHIIGSAFAEQMRGPSPIGWLRNAMTVCQESSFAFKVGFPELCHFSFTPDRHPRTAPGPMGSHEHDHSSPASRLASSVLRFFLVLPDRLSELGGCHPGLSS